MGRCSWARGALAGECGAALSCWAAAHAAPLCAAEAAKPLAYSPKAEDGSAGLSVVLSAGTYVLEQRVGSEGWLAMPFRWLHRAFKRCQACAAGHMWLLYPSGAYTAGYLAGIHRCCAGLSHISGHARHSVYVHAEAAYACAG